MIELQCKIAIFPLEIQSRLLVHYVIGEMTKAGLFFNMVTWGV